MQIVRRQVFSLQLKKWLHGRIFGAGISVENKLFSISSALYSVSITLPPTSCALYLSEFFCAEQGRKTLEERLLAISWSRFCLKCLHLLKEGRLFRFACSLRVWTVFAFTFLYQYSKTWHRGFKLAPHAVFYPSADQSVLDLYGKIVFFATLLGSVFKLIQGTYSPTFLEALVLGLEYFFFFSDEFSEVKLTDFLWPHRFCPALLHWCNKLF